MSLAKRLADLESRVIVPAAPEHVTIVRTIVDPHRPRPVEGEEGVITTSSSRAYPDGRVITTKQISWEEWER